MINFLFVSCNILLAAVGQNGKSSVSHSKVMSTLVCAKQYGFLLQGHCSCRRHHNAHPQYSWNTDNEWSCSSLRHCYYTPSGRDCQICVFMWCMSNSKSVPLYIIQMLFRNQLWNSKVFFFFEARTFQRCRALFQVDVYYLEKYLGSSWSLHKSFSVHNNTFKRFAFSLSVVSFRFSFLNFKPLNIVACKSSLRIHYRLHTTEWLMSYRYNLPL